MQLTMKDFEGRWTHDKKGGDYVVVKVMLLEVWSTVSESYVWTQGVEYTSLEKGGQSFMRTTGRFLSRFRRISAERPS